MRRETAEPTRPPVRRAAHRRLLEACARPGCPACRCVRDAAARRLQAVLAEHVTDPATRGRLTASWGFCAAHAALLRELPDAGLGAAIVYHGLVSRAVGWLEVAGGRRGAPAGTRRWRALLGRSRPAGGRRPRRGACLVCADLRATEGDYLDALVAGMTDPELAAAVERSAGVCLPHLEEALARAGDQPGAARLAALARDRLRRLADELAAFIDKHDHRAAARITAREAEAWTAALALVAGAPEVFGTGASGAGGAAPAARGRRDPGGEDASP